MISIGEFTAQVQALHDTKEILEPLDWNSILEDAGYYSIKFRPKTKQCWDWCAKEFGLGHIAWTGSKFWFESEKDAIMFTLRWGRDN